MRRSNSKEARRAVEAYVLESLETVNERSEYNGTYNPNRPVSSAFELLKDEMSYQSYYGSSSDMPVLGAGLAADYDRAGRHDHYTASTPYRVMWLYASIGELEVYTSSERRLLAEWLDETPEEASRYTDTQAERQFYHMTAAAFERLYDRENTPHKVNTADFIKLYQERNGGHFFDPATLRYFGQTRRSFSVYGYELMTDANDHQEHDCYRVSYRIKSPDGYTEAHVSYFDRDTLAEIHPVKEA